MQRITSARGRILSGCVLGAVLTLSTACGNTPNVGSSDFGTVRGPWLGQTPPGDEPVLFAPGIISTHLFNRDLVMTGDGHEIWFGFGAGGTLGMAVTRIEDGRWTEPGIAPFSTFPHYADFEPALSPGGDRIYFLSNRPPPGREDDFRPGTWGFQHIWYADRTATGWSEPHLLPAPVTVEGENQFYPSLTAEGVLYYTSSLPGGKPTMMRAEPGGEFFAEPEPLDAGWNREGAPYNCFIDQRERFLLICMADEEALGAADYWISFRGPDNTWSEKINLGEKVNLPGGQASSASLSPDGRYFFFATTRVALEEMMSGPRATFDEIMACARSPENGNPSIYWMEADFLENLRPEGFPLAGTPEGGN